jgi:hypothetical protein
MHVLTCTIYGMKFVSSIFENNLLKKEKKKKTSSLRSRALVDLGLCEAL